MTDRQRKILTAPSKRKYKDQKRYDDLDEYFDIGDYNRKKTFDATLSQIDYEMASKYQIEFGDVDTDCV